MPHKLSHRTPTRAARAGILAAVLTTAVVGANIPITTAGGAEAANLLTAGQQTFESTVTGWVEQGNTTIRRTTATAYRGTSSLRVQVDATGLWPDSSRTARAGTLPGAGAVRIEPAARLRGSIWVKPGLRRSPVRCEVRWYQSDGLIIGNTLGSLANEVAGKWIARTCEGTAPAGTTHASLRVFVSNASYGDVHYVDEARLERVGTPTTPTTVAPTTPTTAAPTTPTTAAPTTPTTAAPTTPTTAAPTTPTTVAPTTPTTVAPTTPTEPIPAGTYPAPGSVGYLGSATALTTIDGSSALPAGTTWNGQYNYLEVTGDNVVLDGVFIRGGIDFYGRGTLTVRNSIVEFGYGSWLTIVGRTGGSTIDVRDSTLRWRPGSSPDVGIGAGAIQIQAGLRIIAMRNDISGTADGIQAAGDDTRIEQNWIHNLATIGAYPDNTHNDGIQVYDGDRIVIARNRIDIGFDGVHQNAAVFFQPGDGNSIASPQIVGNYLQGGGFTLRLEKPATSNAIVTDNVFGPLEGGAWGYAYALDGATVAQWTNNRTSSGGTVSQP